MELRLFYFDVTIYFQLLEALLLPMKNKDVHWLYHRYYMEEHHIDQSYYSKKKVCFLKAVALQFY